MTDTRETLRVTAAKAMAKTAGFEWPDSENFTRDRANPDYWLRAADAAMATIFDRLDVLPTNWELSWGEVSDDEGAPCAWRIHRRSGNRSDREWTQLAIGETPTQAMLAALQQENSDGQ